MRAHYGDDVVVWLVNPQDTLERTHDFVGGARVTLPVLFDSGASLYRSYSRSDGSSYAPYPVHVIIDQDGVIRYLAYQYDAVAIRDTIDGLLNR